MRLSECVRVCVWSFFVCLCVFSGPLADVAPDMCPEAATILTPFELLTPQQ